MKDTYMKYIGELWVSLRMKDEQISKMSQVIAERNAEIEGLKADCPCEKNGEPEEAEEKVGLTAD